MGFGIAMKKCGMRDSREKGTGMQDQDPPLPDPEYKFKKSLKFILQFYK